MYLNDYEVAFRCMTPMQGRCLYHCRRHIAWNRTRIVAGQREKAIIMFGVEPRQVSSQQPGRRPTTYLTQSPRGLLSPLDLFLRVREGFALKDVQAMVAASELYSAARVLRRITGKSNRTLARQRDDSGTPRLNAQQSAVAFQYAQALEHAASVFGSKKRAEEWLGRPCKHLADHVPLEMIENSLGFQVVEGYLQRIEFGVYQ